MRGMIVAAQPEAAEVGADILRRGGNAVAQALPEERVVLDHEHGEQSGHGGGRPWKLGGAFHDTRGLLSQLLAHERFCPVFEGQTANAGGGRIQAPSFPLAGAAPWLIL